MKRLTMIVGGTLLGIALIGGMVFFAVSSRQIPTEAAVTALPKDTTDPEAFKAPYPRHFDSYKRNEQVNPPAVRYGGSEQVSNLDLMPYMRTLWAGYGFSKEYNEERGHVYTMEDVQAIQRVNDKTTASCLYCKSAEVPQLLEKYGDEYFTTNFHDIKKEMVHPISCSDCHDPETMDLRLTRPAVVSGLSRAGVAVDNITRQDMGTYVCAQCHVEYFFNPKDAGRVTFPWDKGFEPEQIYQYYKDLEFADWVHPTSGAQMLKTQHPEFETFQGSTHQSNGLSCANCHMPMIKEGTVKITSHWWTSPLRTIEQSCGTCHKQSADELKTRVLYTQDKVRAQLDVAGKTLEAAHELIAEAPRNVLLDARKLDEARELVREGQWYWDYVAADNAMGFHNPQKALDTLAKAIDRGNRAQLIVKDALLAAK
ncbi:MAG TPA: ammonia-forming cytochrome c nitrite reductase subunit c552 [Symbiobacteriaceae bacterium]|nr:ammonia-forming cytochrome c nitrite reductase subunit c552 [Symbiobacteriaceae bacterium]